MKRDRKTSLLIILIVISWISIDGYAQLKRPAPTGQDVNLTHDGRERDYRIHVPKSYDKSKPTPLVLCLHGGGGNSEQMSRSGMTAVSDRHGFILVYPNAINKHWGDGRESEKFAEHERTINDVAYIIAVVNKVMTDYNIDATRVFSTGVSNGGFMTQRLAMEHPEVFSAAAVVIASMGEPLKAKFAPKLPVSILYMNGTDDPLVPYSGGEVAANLTPRLNKLRGKPKASRGRCIPTDDAVALWVKRNGTKQEPEVTQLPDKQPADGSTVEVSLWNGGGHDTVVALYKIVGGGHTVPGAAQYLPERLIGKTNRDIDGFETIWQFFKQHARKMSAP